MSKSARPRKSELRPRFRVLCGKDIALGPGKAELLALVAKTGSIATAAKQMGMSYMRAWTLIKTMERCFRRPLVRAIRGGHKRGGTELTETGEQALALYAQMQARSLRVSSAPWAKLRRLLRS